MFDYVYDGDGQRVLVKQTTAGQTDKTIYIGGYFEVFIKASYAAPTTPPALNCGTRRCVYFPLGILPNNPVAATGQVWKSYYSTGSGRAMRIQDNTNTGGGSGLFWLYADHLGSTTLTASLNGLGGDLISTLSYTAWGETRNSTGATPTSIRYTGQREAEAGLYFYNARWYDPALGRFAQADTIIPGADAISFDRYSYVRNNPVMYNDPSGHIPCEDGKCDKDLGFRFSASVNVNLATSAKWIIVPGIPNAEAFSSSMGQQNQGCGHRALQMIYETITGSVNTINFVFDNLKDVKGNVFDNRGTDLRDLAYFAALYFPNYETDSYGDYRSVRWKATILYGKTTSIYTTPAPGFLGPGMFQENATVDWDGKDSPGYKGRVFSELLRGHYIIASVMLVDGGRLSSTGTIMHWVVIVGISDNLVTVNDPYTNLENTYTWDEFYGSASRGSGIVIIERN